MNCGKPLLLPVAAAMAALLAFVAHPAMARTATNRIEPLSFGEDRAASGIAEVNLAGRGLLENGAWVLNSFCASGQACTTNGTCLGSITYNSTTGCGSNKTESVEEVVTSNCRRAGCGYQNCFADEIQVDSTWCASWPPSFDELCCKKGYRYTCREVLPCSWRIAPSPPPPVPSVAVFAPGGAWDAYAKTDKKVNAEIMAILANTIYEDSIGTEGMEEFQDAFVRKVVAPMGGTRTWVYYQLQDTEWAFIETPTSFIVALRGTEGGIGMDALVSDLTSFLTDPATEFGGSGVRIGQGFYRAFAKNKDFFMSEFLRFKNTSRDPRKPLWLTGHSLGGALASLFGAYLQVQGHNVTGVYTFGSPIVGNAEWKAVYPLPNTTYRYEAPGDPVPLIPPNFDYENHVGVTTYNPQCAASAIATARNPPSPIASPVSTPSPSPKPAAAGRRLSSSLADGATGRSLSSTSTFSSSSSSSSAVRMCGVVRIDDLSAAHLAAPLPALLEQVPCDALDEAASGAVGAARRAAAEAAGPKRPPPPSSKTPSGSPAPKPANAPSPSKASTPPPLSSPGSGPKSPPPRAATTSPPLAKALTNPPPVKASDPPPSLSSPPMPWPPSNIRGAAHSIGSSYLANIFYCVLTPQQQAQVPSYAMVSGWSS